MRYKIKNNVITIPYGAAKQSFYSIISDTLDLYTQGKDISNSPLITSQLNIMHISCCYENKKGKYIPYEGN